ncbi:MAG TPA: glycogen-binding domain-containing protein [Desulfomonilia bacterium]|nr:glycogen-binding domain-containing protein [Desulfomonilia bacterium]
MRDELISLFIDDELGLDEKMDFVELIHTHRSFKDQTVEFLRLEKELRSDVVEKVPEVAVPPFKPSPARSRRPLYLAAAVAAVVMAVLFWPAQQTVNQAATPDSYRFVIYQPGTTQAEITGDFTGWKRVSMEPVGSSGYWEISLDLHPGEHRYVFIINGHQRVVDPTVMTREQDDFGGENSILVTGGNA